MRLAPMHQRVWPFLLWSMVVGALAVTPALSHAERRKSNRDQLRIAQDLIVRGMVTDNLSTRVNSENLANADTPNYVPKEIFKKARRLRGGDYRYPRVTRLKRNPELVVQEYDPVNPMADENGFVNMPRIKPLLVMMQLQKNKLNSERLMKTYQVATDMRHRTTKIINY